MPTSSKSPEPRTSPKPPGRQPPPGRRPSLAALPFAFKQTLPLMAGFAFCGISYGVYTTSIGLPAWTAPFMAVSIFAGSAEFLMADLLTASFAPLTAFLVVFMVNARHIFYGISMLDTYRGAGRKTAFLRYGLIDETFALCQPLRVPTGLDRFWVYTWITLFNLLYWSVSAGAGSYVATQLPIDLSGIDFIMKALFIVIFLDSWLLEPDHRPALIGLGAALGCLVLLGPDGFIVPALLVIAALLLLFRRQLSNEPVNDGLKAPRTPNQPGCSSASNQATEDPAEAEEAPR